MIKSSGHPWIQFNQIFGNHDGLIVIDSNPLIYQNEVYENHRSGIIISGLSFPSIR